MLESRGASRCRRLTDCAGEARAVRALAGSWGGVGHEGDMRRMLRDVAYRRLVGTLGNSEIR